jgi:hypothetical protein
VALADLINPLRRASSTSLSSSGSVEVPKEASKEVGSAIVSPIREIVPDLITKQQEFKTYYQMANFHSATRSSLRAVKSSVMGAEFYVEPASEELEDLDIAEFVEYNLTSAQSSPWRVTLNRILKFCDYGFSTFEHVWEQRDWAPKRKGANRKSYTMLKKLAPRPARSITDIRYDNNGGPVEVIQQAMRSDQRVQEVNIPIQKLLIFTHDEDGGDLSGKSMLRSAYPHWFYIQHLYKVDAIQKERHGMGVPYGVLPPGYTDADRDAAFEMVSNLRTNEKAGVVYPEGYVFGFLKVEGNLVDVLRSVDHHNAMVMLNVLAEFLMAGLTEAGSRATSASQQDIFTKANRSMADIICDVFNLYLVPYIVGFNFDTDRFPLVRARNIGDTRDQQQLASALANMFAQEILTPDLDTENWARRVFDMPRKIGERPEFSPTQIRKIINESIQDGTTPEGVSTSQGNGTTSQKGNVTARIKSGNMGKGNNVS